MRIRTLTQFSLAALLALSLAAVLAVTYAMRAEKQAAAVQEQAQEVAHEVTGLLVLTQEFARNAEAGTAQQWHARQRTLAEALSGEDAAADSALKELRHIVKALPPLFVRLEEIGTREDAFSRRRKEVLLDQLVTNNQAVSDLAYQWYREAAEYRQSVEQRFHLLAVLTPLLLGLLLLALNVAIRRRLLRPMSELDRATTAVARGDWTVRLDSRAQDEFGDLARRFDDMTSALAANAGQLRHSEKQLRMVTDSLPMLIAYLDADLRYRFVNAQFMPLLGLDPATLLGKTVREAVGEARYAVLDPHLQAALGGEHRHFDRVNETEVGPVHLHCEYIPDYDEQGRVQGLFTMALDVSERVRAEERVRASEQRLRDLTDQIPAMVGHFDREERCLFANSTVLRHNAIDPAHISRHTLRSGVGEAAYELHKPHIEKVLRGERSEFEGHVLRKGRDAWFQAHLVPVRAPDGAVTGFYVMSFDVTPLKLAERKLQALARVDNLTGLPNRLAYNEALPAALARADRSGQGLALMFLDVDKFKSINDGLGHAAGDQVLKEFAQRLKASVRQTDTVARLAGDEFVVFLEGLRASAEAEVVAGKIVAAMRPPFLIEGRELAVSTSVGLAFRAAGPCSAEELLARADAALYEAKAAGRNTYRMAS